ncbi:MAG: 16S rRNA (guanine(527)-N(7))-methyltransferase RsmG [Terracidiphilus sp.]|nr:16S rRNA (guanine(527)-N(7))-methyltransferase RsmG [Terracidiphilus sp.]MDR3799537.1 16S rRNA (guanine(527)-N(7))-methyltransferase RsmG [Terracidiphilus sp.]
MGASETRTRLRELLTAGGLPPLDDATAGRLEDYVSLFLRWNERVNLSAVRDEEGVLSRHIIESIKVSSVVPRGIKTLLDFGSGAGLPGIPIAICRPEIAVTLAESQGKKAAFLQEAVRVLGIGAKVHAGRAEALRSVFDCVTLRAVDKMPKAVAAAVRLVAPGGWLALMTTGAEIARLRKAAGTEISWSEPVKLPFGDDRILALGQRINSAV